jgi:type IV pilus assembly protein PilM
VVFFSHLLSKESVVGIDIGSNSIKVVCIEPTKQGPRISQVAVCPTPPQAVKEGVVTSTAEVANAIQFAIRSAGIKAPTAVTAIAGPGVIVRNVKVPKMSEDALRKSIRFEAGKFISSSIDDSIVEFDILGDSDEEGQLNAVLVAAPRGMVETKVVAIEQAGLEPLSVDVEAFALLRALQCLPDSGIPAEGTVALLDMGASHTEINLITNGDLALTRTIPIAGNNLTVAIRNARGCTDEEAEEMKFSVDLQALMEQSDESRDDAALRAVQPLVDELLREIRRSINYYQSQLPDGSDATVDTLILTGGTARMKGLVDYTKSRLNVTAIVGSPVLSSMYGFSSDPSGISVDDVPLLAVGLGLALKEMPVASLVAAA